MDEASSIRAALSALDDPLQVVEAIIENAPLAFVVCNREGRCVLANEACAALLGSTPPAGYNILKDENLERAGFSPIVARAFAGETVNIPPMWYDPRDLRHVDVPDDQGRRAATEVTAFPVRDRAGEVSHVVFAIRDAAAELQLKDANEKFERLRSAGMVGVFEFRTDGERPITDANDTFLNFLGYTREDLVRGEIKSARMTPPEYRAADDAAIAEGVRPGKLCVREKEYLRKDGSRAPVLLAGAVFESDPQRGIGLLLDNSERKRADLERAASETRFRALVASSNDAMALRDASGRITYASESVVRVLGVTAEQLVGRTPSNAFVHPEDVAALEAGEAQVLREPGVAVRTEVRLIHADGEYRNIEMTRTNMLDDPAVRSIVVNMRDITETRALQQRFIQSQKMEAVGQLAGGIAHDFNNMLSAILGFAGIVASELPAADPLASDVQEIIAAAERAAALTRQLLAFSRRQVLVPKVIDLTTQLRSLERMLRRILGEATDLVMTLAPDLAPVKVDPTQIEQAVLNLVINARDALAPGGRITVETSNAVIHARPPRGRSDLAPGAYVLIRVADDGIGMTKAVRERVFEPFFTTKELGHGTGLGLATVLGIVQQSGGHIELSSEPGEGATFAIYLPVHDGMATAPDARVPGSSAGPNAETILLVEDEPGVRSFARRALERSGYLVLEASNGIDALQLAERHAGPIHLLLTDVVMPRMSGPTLAARLLEKNPSLGIVYMSGYDEGTPAVHDVSHGKLVAKPIAFRTLLSTVRAALDRSTPEGTQGQQ